MLIQPDATVYFAASFASAAPHARWAWGYSIRDSEGKYIRDDRGRIASEPNITRFVCEYVAVGLAIKCYRELGRTGPLLVRGSSAMVIQQMRGVWTPQQGEYLRTYYCVRALVDTCPFPIQWEQIPKDETTRADMLSKLALEEVGFSL